MIDTRTAILSYAENRSSFKFSDLLCYLNTLTQISKVTLSWYLREMVKENLLFKLGRGIYTQKICKEVEYKPRLRKKAVRVSKNISKAFPFITISVFDGEVLGDFQHHLSTNNVIYIEVDRDVTESVFHFLKKSGFVAYLNPSKDFVYDNIDLSKESIIVKPLVTESPLTTFDGVRTPNLEKILVDILCDDDLDYLRGSEWRHIFENAINMYQINRTAMLRYASRRNAKTKIEDALTKL